MHENCTKFKKYRRKKTHISVGFDIKSLREAIIKMAPRGGLEPPTNGLTAQAKTPKNSLNRPTKALLKET